jgi:hypothetical protein
LAQRFVVLCPEYDLVLILQYASVVQDISLPGYIPFTNKTMVDTAHSLGMEVVPWTIK